MKTWALVLGLLGVQAFAAEHGEWTYEAKVDDFTDEVRHIAKSPMIFGHPYDNARFYVGCKTGGPINAYVSFGYYNPTGQSRGKVEVRFDQQPLKEMLVRGSASGKSFFFEEPMMIRMPQFSNQQELFKGLTEASVVKMRILYYDYGNATLSFGLQGAASAVTKVLDACCGLGQAAGLSGLPEKAQWRELLHIGYESSGHNGLLDREIRDRKRRYSRAKEPSVAQAILDETISRICSVRGLPAKPHYPSWRTWLKPRQAKD